MSSITVDSYVSAKVSHVTNKKFARTHFGDDWKEKRVIGRVRAVKVDYPNGRKRTTIEAEFKVTRSYKKRKSINDRSVQFADPPVDEEEPEIQIVNQSLQSY